MSSINKFVIVTGGVMSGIGKGVTVAAIGKLFQFRGYSVCPIKIDPYLNVDPGTMNPGEHGEIFVSDEVFEFKPVGDKDYVYRICESDLDLGNYERFLDVNVHPSQNITSGQVFLDIILNERRGKYQGQTVQMIPHVSNKIIERIENLKNKAEILLIEVGGTVGDIEGNIFLEALRQLRLKYGMENVVFIHVTWVPYLGSVAEYKTKPTQHSIRELLARGIVPDFVVCRSEKPIPAPVKDKIALFGNLSNKSVISNPNLDVIYEIPLIFEEQGFGDLLSTRLRLQPRRSSIEISKNVSDWQQVTELFKYADKEVTIGIAGKYMQNKDTYISVREALSHAAAHLGARLKIKWIDTDSNINYDSVFQVVDGILVPGGFGARGTEGKIKIAMECVNRKIPYLGICLGLQMAVVALARMKLGLKDANSQEIDPNTPHPVIAILESQKNVKFMGGTMRLGKYRAILKPNTLVYDAYGVDVVEERHRHRLEVNPEYIPLLEEKGVIFSGFSEKEHLAEFMELDRKKHPFFVGTQAHPEFKSRPHRPHPLYKAFVKAALERKYGAN